MSTDGSGIGRRALLRRAALAGVSCVLGVAAEGTSARADTKVTAKGFGVSDHPEERPVLRHLRHGARGCKIVRGRVSPQGWCAFFATKTPK